MASISATLRETHQWNIAMQINEISGVIVDTAFKVHTALGPGLLETVYEAVLEKELLGRGLRVRRQVVVPIRYDGLEFDEGFIADLILEECIVV
jgi:GxxExxY protein